MLTIFFAVSLTANAQGIPTRAAAPSQINQNTVPKAAFGTENFLGNAPEGYIGQELCLVGKWVSLREYGWENICQGLSLCDYRSSGTPYERLAGKCFEVLAVIPVTNNILTDALLRLKDKGSGEVWTYNYSSKYKSQFPFLAPAYIAHLNTSLKGKEFVSRGWNGVVEINADGQVPEVNSGEMVSFAAGTMWTCAEVTVEQTYYSVVMVLRNSSGKEVFFPAEASDNPQHILHKETFEQSKAKFGSTGADAIIKGTVFIGMHKDAAILSWGVPDKINETLNASGKREQWVYDKQKQFLYIENGKVSAIQSQ